MERLQKIIAQAGIASRRKAEELILEGKVRVNGVVVRELGTKVSPMDAIEVGNQRVVLDEKEYYLLNKPRGVISSLSDEHGRKTVIDLINTTTRIYPVGRLDYDTTGLLILTNDGELTNLLTHPSHGVEKVYVAKLEGIISGEDILKLKKGIIVDGVRTIPSRVKLRKKDREKETSIVEISIVEGRNHIVKKIFATLGYEVLKLKRESYAFLTLDNLKSGEYRKLSVKEVKKLYNLGN